MNTQTVAVPAKQPAESVLRKTFRCREIIEGGFCSEEADANLPVDLGSAGDDDIARAARCPEHAEKLRRAGQKLFPIGHTLEIIARIRQEKEDEQRIGDYLAALAARSFGGALTDEQKKIGNPRPLKNERGEHLCGLPSEVGCCRHDRPVGKYIVLAGGLVVGLCEGAARRAVAQASVQVVRRVGAPALPSDRLRTYDSLEKAKTAAADSFRPRLRRGADFRSPLNNWTDPKASARHAANQARRAEENRLRALGGGGGQKNSSGKKNKNKKRR